MPFEPSITTEAAFHRRLGELLVRAASNGVDVEGGWPVVNRDPDARSWDVEIVELSRSG